MRWLANARKCPALVLLIAVAALGGCSMSPPGDGAAPPGYSSAAPGGGGEPPGDSPAPSGDAGSSQEPPAPAPDGGSGQNGSGQNNGVQLAWVPPGPVDAGDPPQSQWYKLLEAKDCDGLAAAVASGNANTEDGPALYGAAIAVCRAVYQGQSSGWTDAAAALAPLQEPDPERCHDRAAYQLVAAALAVHAQDPSVTPVPVAGTGTACPLGLTGLDAQQGDGPTDAPSSGLAGGRFQLVGRFLDVTAVQVGEQSVTAEPDPDQQGRWVVVIPAAATAGTVTVTAEGSGGSIPGSLTFTYVGEGATPPESATPTSDAPSDLPAPVESAG